MSTISQNVLYVENPRRSADLYSKILGVAPVVGSENFIVLPLANGFTLGLWNKAMAQPAATSGGGIEVMFIAANDEEVRTTYAKWSELGLPMAQEVTKMPFGLTFVATDPDGHRLRVCALTGV
jgi:predicted enzyme related to lactoylglutathione lyase